MADDKDTALRLMAISSADTEVSVLHLQPKVFSSGSRGYWAGGKLEAPDGKRYQLSCSIVEIGSKPEAVAKPGKGK